MSNWIAKATKNKGGLHRSLGIAQGKTIPKSKIEAAAKEGGKVGKQARLAETLEGLRGKRDGDGMKKQTKKDKMHESKGEKKMVARKKKDSKNESRGMKKAMKGAVDGMTPKSTKAPKAKSAMKAQPKGGGKITGEGGTWDLASREGF